MLCVDRKVIHKAFNNDKSLARVRFDDQARETYEQHEVRRTDYQDMRANHTIKNYHHHFEVEKRPKLPLTLFRKRDKPSRGKIIAIFPDSIILANRQAIQKHCFSIQRRNF